MRSQQVRQPTLLTQSRITATLLLAFFLLVTFTFTACSTNVGNEKLIRLSTSIGASSVLFERSIAPILQQQGFRVEYIRKQTLVEAAEALATGEADLNVEQNYLFTTQYNQIRGTDLVNIAEAPTVAAGLYSRKHEQLAELSDAQTVGLPNFPGNLSRALRVLEKAGFVSFSPTADRNNLTIADVISNPHNLELQVYEPDALLKQSPDLDWVVFPGALAHAANLSPDQRLLGEDFLHAYLNTATIRRESQNTAWANAVVRAYESDQFDQQVRAINTDNRWVLPQAIIDPEL